jgi:hypothetical protein
MNDTWTSWQESDRQYRLGQSLVISVLQMLKTFSQNDPAPFEQPEIIGAANAKLYVDDFFQLFSVIDLQYFDYLVFHAPTMA